MNMMRTEIVGFWGTEAHKSKHKDIFKISGAALEQPKLSIRNNASPMKANKNRTNSTSKQPLQAEEKKSLSPLKQRPYTATI